MENFRFDWTVDIGQIGIAFSLVFSAAVFFLRLGERVKVVETEIRKQTDILITMAKQEENIRYLEKRMDYIEGNSVSKVA